MKILDAAVGEYERVVWATDEATGLQAVVAVHSTVRGPALGGTRFFPYADSASAVIDAMRLAEGMTLKAAVAGLPLGGGKAVVIGDPAVDRTPARWRAFAGLVDLFEGRFITAEDVGTTLEDMDELRRHTPHVVGLSTRLDGGGDPSPFTARGVLSAMRAAWEAESGEPGLAGARIVVQGVGKVGGYVAAGAAAEGADVVVSDPAGRRAAEVAAAIGATVVAPADALLVPCDILAPCALGGVLSPATAPALSCSWVVGAANNQLSDDHVADLLAERGVGYVPDFVANAGGLICVSHERAPEGWDAERVARSVDGIGETVRELIDDARLSGTTPLAAARRLARARVTPVPAA